MQRFTAIGNVVRDAELRYTPSGIAVTRFSIAVNEKRKDTDDHTEFIKCTAWRRLAEVCGEYLKKGKQVYVEGKIRNDKQIVTGKQIEDRLKEE